MAKMTYLEVVELLGQSLKGADKSRVDHIIARKKALKEEDGDLDAVLDGLLRELQGEQPND